MEIKRDLHLQKLIAKKHNRMIKVITGIRRCGKSYLLFNLFCQHLKEEGIDDDHIIKIDLENRRNKSLRDPDILLNYIDGKMKDQKMYYILIDEIQYVSEFEDVLNSYLSVENADVYVTGSNSKFLSKDVITEFRGRGDEIHLHPLSFKEVMSVKEGVPKEDVLLEYMMYGGLPQAVQKESDREKREYLQRLFTQTFLRDIKERYNIKNDDDLKELVNIVASSIGGLTNATKIRNTFKTVKQSNISHETISNYLEYLEDAFLIDKAVRYDIKGRRYIDTPVKYYFSDTGLRNARLNFRQLEQTHLLENVVYNELKRRDFSVDVGQVTVNMKDDDGKSVRNQLEVDFVCNEGYKRLYIQVAWRIDDEEKRAQEQNSLQRINDSFRKIIIVGDHSHRYQNDEGILFMNIYEFLADQQSLDV